jgi:tight adherence protein C
VADVRSFVHSFMHAERYGVPIAQVLRSQSSEMRDKRRQRAEERAAKIPVKLVFPLTLCILPALFVVVAGPAVVRISHAFGM